MSLRHRRETAPNRQSAIAGPASDMQATHDAISTQSSSGSGGGVGGGEEVRRGGRCGWEAQGEGWASVVCMRRVSVIIGHGGEGSTLHEREKPLYTEATGHKGALLRWCFVNFILSVVLFWGRGFFVYKKAALCLGVRGNHILRCVCWPG